MNNKMITIPYADAIEYGENTSALFKALWELTDLIRLESDLKKHHRAYLHVREDIDEKVKEARQIMTKVSVDMIGFYFKVDVPESSNSGENTPFADAADDEAVSIPKDKYELMIDDLLTMSEINQSCRAPPLCDTVVSGKYFIAESDQLTASILTAHADVSVMQAKPE